MMASYKYDCPHVQVMPLTWCGSSESSIDVSSQEIIHFHFTGATKVSHETEVIMTIISKHVHVQVPYMYCTLYCILYYTLYTAGDVYIEMNIADSNINNVRTTCTLWVGYSNDSVLLSRDVTRNSKARRPFAN